MPNPLSNLLRPFLPAAPVVEKAADKPMAMGVVSLPTTSLRQTIGQPQDADFSIIYGLYRYNADVAASVHKWAGGITSSGWDLRLMDEEATATTKQTKQIKELKVWLRRPNPNRGMRALLYTVVQHLAINGDAFWYVSRDSKGMPLEIWPMHPSLTRILATREGEVLGYVMLGPDGSRVTFEPEEVIHFQLPSPQNDIYGEGRVELIVEEAGIDLQALRSNKSIFLNGLSPSALLLLDDKATQEDARMLTETIRQGHSGSDNRHKILALARVQDFKPYSLSPKDMDFLGLRNLATEKVTSVMGVPKVLLGNHNSGDYATTKFLVREMHQNVFIPVQQIIAETITEHLIHSINPDLEWFLHEPDASDPDVLRKDLMTAADKKLLTADEVRQDGFGKDPLTDEQKEELKPAPVVAPGIANQGNPSNKPNGDTPDELDEGDGKAETAPKEVKGGGDKARKSLVTKADDGIDPLAIERDREMEELEQALIQPIADHFSEQQAEYLNRLPETPTEQALETFINAGAAAMDNAFALLLGSLLFKPFKAGIQAAQTQLYEVSGNTPQGNLKIDLALRFDQVNPVVDQYVRTTAFTHVQGINQTTRNQLRVTLAEGIRLGETIPELSDRIAAVFDAARSWRTDLIARTETAQAFAFANHAALELLFKDGLIKYRKWLCAPDDRVCGQCLPLNGYVIRFDAKYPDGLEPGFVHPGDRCTEVGLVGDEEELEAWRRT